MGTSLAETRSVSTQAPKSAAQEETIPGLVPNGKSAARQTRAVITPIPRGAAPLPQPPSCERSVVSMSAATYIRLAGTMGIVFLARRLVVVRRRQGPWPTA